MIINDNFLKIYIKMENWYTYKQAIEILGITPQTLSNWRRSGKIIYKILSKKTFLYQFHETNIIWGNESLKNI